MNTCINCGCDDAYPSQPPSPTPAPCPDQQPCAEFFDAQCIVLTTPDIKCGDDIVIAENASVLNALEGIVSYFCQRLVTLTNYINSQLSIINGRLTTIEGDIVTIQGQITSLEGSSVQSVTGLNTDNTDPLNPIVKISVDGTTITGLGTPASPLVATGGGGGSISGSGIDAYVARWTPNGTTLGTGVIRDNNSTVGINNNPISSAQLSINSSVTTGISLANSFLGTIATGMSITVTGNNSFSNEGLVANAQNSTGNNRAIRGVANSTVGTNIGLTGSALNGAANYAIQLFDGTEGIGKVLTCVTADGKANWVSTNLQKVITTSYTLTDADNDYTIFINNGASAITISLGAITIANFSVGFIQEGSADVTFSGAGLSNPVGLKCLGQGYQTFIERKLSTSTYYLLGNTKA